MDACFSNALHLVCCGSGRLLVAQRCLIAGYSWTHECTNEAWAQWCISHCERSFEEPQGLPIHLMNDHKPLRITSPFVWRSPVPPYNQDLFFFLALENKQQTHCTLASWLTLVICFLACQPGFWVLQLESLRQQIVNQCTLSNWLYCLSLYSRWLTYESVANFTRRGRQTSSSRKCLLTCLSIILSFLLLVWWGTLNWTHYDMGWMMQTYIGLIKLIALLSP